MSGRTNPRPDGQGPRQGHAREFYGIINRGVDMTNKKLLTVEEVAERLRVRKETVRRYIREGSLEALSLPGGSYRVREDAIAAMLKVKGASNEMS